MKRLVALLLLFSVLVSLTCMSAYAETDAKSLSVPKIEVNTVAGNGTNLQKADDYVDADITIIDADGICISDRVRFKVRGNSTALTHITKKAYTFKFEDKVDLLGMGKGKKWALLANAFDPSLLRNHIAFDFAHEMNLSFTSEQSIVELWLDGSYRGCYTLMEPVEKGKDQVNIDIESNNGMKDFMIEREETRYESDVTYFKTDGIRFAISEPEEPNAEQTAYIESTMNDIMTAIKSGDRNAIEDKIDVPSFTRFYLLNELYKTVDFDYSSVFFYYKDGKLYAGPAWDYDIAAGNINSGYSQLAKKCASPEGLIASEAHLYKYLCSYDWFNEEIRNTYRDYYGYINNIAAEGGLIDSLLNEYGDVFKRNFTDAGWEADKLWVNVQMSPFGTFEENLEYFRKWIADRNSWLSDYYDICQDITLMGDANEDCVVNIKDATAIQKHIAGLITLTETGEKLADVDENTSVNIKDATAIQKFIAGIDTGYKIGEEIITNV